MTLCPSGLEEPSFITLAHGSGGRHSHRLMQELFLPFFKNEHLDPLHDGAFLSLPHTHIAFTTDSFVVQPLFFPGGDIGTLAITGTANDLAMCGAKPLYLSCGFIIEEGFPKADLQRIVTSMHQAARIQSIHIVTGDTKVIERKTGNNLFINTSGIGIRVTETPLDALQIHEGDAILLSSDVGRHGMAVMAEREQLRFATPLISDCAPLFPLVHKLLERGIRLHALRDLTRGGLATALVELSESAHAQFVVKEKTIHVTAAVASACELLGFDPLYVANEGRFVAFLPEEQVPLALDVLKNTPEGAHASLIGSVDKKSSSPAVLLQNGLGSTRRLHRLVGEQLPRIC